MPGVLNTGRIPALIPLGFGLWWLWGGAAALLPDWRIPVIVFGVIVIVAAGIRLLTRAIRPGERRFRMGWRFAVTIAAEVAGLVIALNIVQAMGRMDLILPAIGIVVGLHFIGIWWENPRPHYLWTAAAMTVLNVVALFLPDPRALAGLGSAAVLAMSVAAS